MYEISFNLASFLTNYFRLSVINLSSSPVHITSTKLLVIFGILKRFVNPFRIL